MHKENIKYILEKEEVTKNWRENLKQIKKRKKKLKLIFKKFTTIGNNNSNNKIQKNDIKFGSISWVGALQRGSWANLWSTCGCSKDSKWFQVRSQMQFYFYFTHIHEKARALSLSLVPTYSLYLERKKIYLSIYEHLSMCVVYMNKRTN